MADYSPTATQTLSPWAQGKLDQVLRCLLHDLHHVIPEHEIVLSLVTAVRSALLDGVPEHDLPAAVENAVRSDWASLPADGWPHADGPTMWRPLSPRATHGVGLLQLDADMRIAALDEEARAALGTGGTGLTGTSVIDLIETAHRPTADAALRRAGSDGARALVVPLQTDAGQHAILATAPVSGTRPQMRACAVARLPELPSPRGEDGWIAPAASLDSYCLIECTVAAGGGSAALPALADELQTALGPSARILTDGDRIAALLPAQGTIAALRHADRIAHLMRTICTARGLDRAQLDTTMVCVGSRRSLLRLLHRDVAEPVW